MNLLVQKNVVILLVYVEISWGLLLGEGVIEQVCLNKLVETVASNKNQNNHVQNSHYIRTLYWVGRLSFSRFSLAIQTLATAVSLGKEKKVLSLFFLLLFMTINCCTIQQLSLIQRIIDADLSSLQNGFAGNLAWFSVSVRGHHGWS